MRRWRLPRSRTSSTWKASRRCVPRTRPTSTPRSFSCSGMRGTARAHLRANDWMAAVLIVILVSTTAIPGLIPLLLIQDGFIALRVANVLQIGLLFFVGYWWAHYSGSNRWLVGMAIALWLGTGSAGGPIRRLSRRHDHRIETCNRYRQVVHCERGEERGQRSILTLDVLRESAATPTWSGSPDATARLHRRPQCGFVEHQVRCLRGRTRRANAVSWPGRGHRRRTASQGDGRGRQVGGGAEMGCRRPGS